MAGGQSSTATASFLDAMGAPPQLRAQLSVAHEIDVYPENWPAVRVFALMSTQWRVGMMGAIGLDYTALPVVEARSGVTNEDPADLFWAVREMELEVLKIYAERRND